MSLSENPIISYSQHREDVLLHRLFRDRQHGFYIDVGAHHPQNGSVTRLFHGRGWRGINIEPGINFPLFLEQRPGDINLHLAVSDRPGTVTFHEYPAMPAVSRISSDIPDTLLPYAEGRVARTVPTMPLRSIFEQHWPEAGVEFMSIDVEGHELEVIRGNDWSRFRPRALVIEATLPFSPTPCHHEWDPLLLEADYLFAYFDGLNRFYVRREDEPLLEHFRVPVNVFDDYVGAEVVDLRERLHVVTEKGKWDVARLTAELSHVQEVLAHTTAELTRLQQLLAGTGARALSIGLGVARFLHRFKRTPSHN